MYFKCTWCGTRLLDKPLYYTEGFLELKPNFRVFCNAECSLAAHQENLISMYDPETDEN